jgi:hypothetical protein
LVTGPSPGPTVALENHACAAGAACGVRGLSIHGHAQLDGFDHVGGRHAGSLVDRDDVSG